MRSRMWQSQSRLRTQISREMSVLHAARIRIEILTQEILIEMVTETTTEIQIIEDTTLTDVQMVTEITTENQMVTEISEAQEMKAVSQTDSNVLQMTETRAIEITTETMTEITIEITALRKKLLLLHLQRM